MLIHNEPYRYALPRTTEAKLRRLRVKATGQRRKGGGPKKCEKAAAKLPGGSCTIKSLATVCQVEGLPAPQPLSPGERRTVHASGCAEFVTQIASAQVVPRRMARRDPAVAIHGENAPHACNAKANLRASCRAFHPHRADGQRHHRFRLDVILRPHAR